MSARGRLTAIVTLKGGSSDNRRSRLGGESGFTMFEVLVVVALMGVIMAIAAPMFGNALANFRLSGDVRSVSNAIALSKMRAASNFSRVRLYIDLSSNSHHLEAWDKAAATWSTVGGSTFLSSGVSLGFAPVSTSPPPTSAAIAATPLCMQDDGVTTIAATGCVIFNSRGVPVDASGAPTPLDQVYLTDGTDVYAVTVSTTGMVAVWRTPPVSTPTWVRQ